MDYKTYQEYSNIQGALDIRKENVIEILQLFVLISNIQKLTFLKYDFKYNNFIYGFTVNGYEVIEDDINFINNKYSIVLKDGDIIFGKITFNRKIWYRQVLKELLKKSRIALRKIFEIEKDLLSQNTPLNIFIVTDKNTTKFANKLQTNLDILLNAEINVIYDITKISDVLHMKNSKNIIIYTIQNGELINDDSELLRKFNEFIIVIGPNNHNLSLSCGKLNIENYVSIDEFSPENIKNIILDTKYKLLNKNKYDNKIIAVSGVSGGIGATTISMNTADIIARNNPSKNVLYIDLSTTKAISNLFLSQNPIPNHSIIDLVNMNDFNIKKNLELGLVKIRENFYSINGIQKHIDRDILEKEIFIEKMLDYILKASEHFNYIIIDTGISDASSLKSSIYDLVNEIWILTEMTLPHVSKLKTFYSLMKRAGLKDKVNFIVNRVNSLNEISSSDFDSIMNTSSKEEKLSYIKIPNDYQTLGKCWNYCELASQISQESPFVKTLEDILKTKEFISKTSSKTKDKKNIFSFLNKE
ncbi:AAA family ATPase [Halarcobacter sp.]|uniref:AAA family ATPase n=1 Tax=Halarcobacter sp. TaxID=2321133 RepID=UPI0029F4AAA0|nr:AAA family ATPase [Halarcobacter sp.]